MSRGISEHHAPVNNNYESKLDIFKQRDATGPQSTLIRALQGAGCNLYYYFLPIA